MCIVKNGRGSHSDSHRFLLIKISAHTSRPRLNSFFKTCSVECVTLKVEFCAGYAGVMIFMSWNLSALFTRSSHTLRPCPSSTIGVNITGVLHCHASQSWKNEYTSMDGAAFGYSWHTLATSSARLTPPKYPRTLEYTPRSFAHTLRARRAMRKASWLGTNRRS